MVFEKESMRNYRIEQKRLQRVKDWLDHFFSKPQRGDERCLSGRKTFWRTLCRRNLKRPLPYGKGLFVGRGFALEADAKLALEGSRTRLRGDGAKVGPAHGVVRGAGNRVV